MLPIPLVPLMPAMPLTPPKEFKLEGQLTEGSMVPERNEASRSTALAALALAILSAPWACDELGRSEPNLTPTAVEGGETGGVVNVEESKTFEMFIMVGNLGS